MSAPLLAVALAALALALHAGAAGAVILPAATIDGPSQTILGFGGVAMAEDGTGGVVYLKRVEGVAHVFVSRYLDGQWQAPIRVDGGEPFAAGWPRIGAANGGELVVVWATPFALENKRPIEELLGATLGPGAASFGQAMIVDQNIREGIGTSPDLAMSSTGQADVVYRVVETEPGRVATIPLLHPGDVVGTVRVAHFNGERWSALGPINRNSGISMRAPTAANAPQIAIGPTGNGVVVWQEPEIAGVARIWARRLFGSTLDYVLPVSAATVGSAPIHDDADAPSAAVSLLGEAEVAYRQSASPGSPLPGPRIFVNMLPDGESASGAQFQGAIIADPTVAAGAAIGPPSIDIDSKQGLRLLYDGNGAPRFVEGTDLGLSGTLTLGPVFAGAEVSAASVMNPAGGGISAWPSTNGQGQPALAVREDFPTGAVQTALVGGGGGGPIGELAVARSGLGDGIVAFLQGQLGNAAIVAVHASAPPAQLVLGVPKGWAKPSQAIATWTPVLTSDGPASYTIVLDGHRVPTPVGATRLRLSARGLGSGRHRVQLLATDIAGGSTLSAPSALRIDGVPPTVRITRSRGGHGVSVRISDAYSGVATRAVGVSFGDGARARARTRFSHRYARGGVYTVTVSVRDRLGISGVVRQLVSVR